MNTILGFLKQKQVIQTAGIAALGLLVWFEGPKIVAVDMRPLESEVNRLLVILALMAAWTLYILFQQSLSHRKEQQLMADLAAPQVDSGRAAIEAAQEKEADDLRRKFEDALALLERTRSKGKRSQQYLYELPWYVIIGAPGCGKTTLLANSGLNFPLSQELGQKDLKGVGGTRNCDWLITDEAIFLDTAGRYATQDSHQPVDAAAWHRFLELLKKHRPRRPINGVLVAVSISDLLQQTEEERRRQAGLIHRRMVELMEELGLRFPIYMIFTKCDLIAGFTDFFAQLDRQECAQVWGETFQEQDAKLPKDFIAGFIHNFDELLRRLRRWAFTRIQTERDVQRRSLIYNFPRQMSLLKPKMEQFLHQLFAVSRFEKTVMQLRGVYLTSATQEGNPIDRVIGLLSSAYGLDRQQTVTYSPQGKSYFIQKLLKEVIFSEAQLAGVNLNVERRRRWLQLATYAAVLLVAAGVIALWSKSYHQNAKAIAGIQHHMETYQKLSADTATWDGAVRSLCGRLDEIQTANAIYRGGSFWMRFGLNQGEKLQAGLDKIYDALLRSRFLPLVKAQLEQRIHARLYGGSESDIAVLYELLKVYLMLGDQSVRMDRGLAARRIKNDWQRSFAREPDLYEDLNTYTDALLNLGLDPVELDQPLIASARRRLNSQPLYAQIYAHLIAAAEAGRLHDFNLSDVLPPESDKVFAAINGQKLSEVSIPGLLTYDGYHNFFKKEGPRAVKEALREDWVTKNYAVGPAGDPSRVFDDVERIYFDQYAKQWQGLLNNLTLKKARNLSQEIEILFILSGPKTPLLPLLTTVAHHTTLAALPEEKQADSDTTDPSRATASMAEQALLRAAVSPEVLRLEEKFETINYLVRCGADALPPVQTVMLGLDDLRKYMMQVGGGVMSDEKALEKILERIQGGGGSERIEAVQREFARLPEPLNNWLSSLTSSGLVFTLVNARSELNIQWKIEVLSTYKKSLEGRYPVYRNSPYDSTLNDFSRFFGANGTIAAFFQEHHLDRFVDTTHSTWRTRKIDNQRIDWAPETLKQLQSAAKIRKSFFAGGGELPSARFELKPLDMDSTVAYFKIDLEGQTSEYRHGPLLSQKFVWPGPSANAGVRLSFKPLDGRQVSHLEEGPWAWLRILDKAAVESDPNRPNQFRITFRVGPYRAYYELKTDSVYHPFLLTELQNFRCPESF